MSQDAREQDLWEIGRGIASAVEFMRTAFSEIQLLHKDIERQFGGIRLYPLSQSFLYLDDNSQNLEAPTAWLQGSMGRLYSRGGSKEPADQLAIVEVHLQAGHGFDEPVVVVGVASWTSPRTPSELGNAYGKDDWIWRLAPERLEPGVPVSVGPGKALGGEDIRLAAWRMTRLTNGAAVQRHVVETVAGLLRK